MRDLGNNRIRLTLITGLSLILLFIQAQATTPDSISLDSTAYGLEKVIVKGRKADRNQIVTMEKGEELIGRTDNLYRILLLNPGAVGLSGPTSAIMAQGEGIYDNQFLIQDISLFSFSHYAGQQRYDAGALGITSAKRIDFYVGNSFGLYSGASGSVMDATPSFASLNPKLRSRAPEFLINMGVKDKDLICYKRFSPGHQYQLAAKISHTPKSERKFFPDFPEYAHPVSYKNLQYLGGQKGKRLELRQFCMVGYDSFLLKSLGAVNLLGPDPEVPWGMAAFSLRSHGSNLPWQATFGGSQQYYLEGKQLGPIVSAKRVDRRTVSASWKTLEQGSGGAHLNAGARIEYLQWIGKAQAEDERGYILISPHQGDGDETVISARAGVANAGKKSSWGGDLLCGLYLPFTGLFADAGIFGERTLGRVRMRADLGTAQSRPDIRGIPDCVYRTKQIRSGTAQFKCFFFEDRPTGINVGVYGKYKGHVPLLMDNPYQPYWNTSRDASLFAGGAHLETDLKWWEYVRIKTNHTINRAMTKEDATYSRYRWDFPWENELLAILSTPGGLFTWFTNIQLSSGLLYKEPQKGNGVVAWSPTSQRMPHYRRIGIKLQLNQPVTEHPILTQYDAYVSIDNILTFASLMSGHNPDEDQGWIDYKEYYWDEDYLKHPYRLNEFKFDIGLRIGLRL